MVNIEYIAKTLNLLKQLRRTHYTHEITPKLHGQRVVLMGWVHSIRDHGGVLFVVLRDSHGLRQLVARKDVNPDVFRKLENITVESCIAAEGVVKEDPRAPGGAEVILTRVEVLAHAENPLPFPINKPVRTSFPKRIDHRHLDIRRPEVKAVFKVREEVVNAAREYLRSRGFTEIHTPKIIASATEGGAELFALVYYGREAFLSQSPQLYKQTAILAFERVFEVAPCFRAQSSHTPRHLTEFWGIDVEIAFSTYLDAMEVLEGLVTHVFRSLTERRKEELELLGVKLKVPNTPFKRITYDEALEIARGKGKQVEWGFDIPEAAERAVCEEFKEPFFVIDYPVTARAFYYMPNPENPELTLSFDLFSPGKRGVELASGGQRIHDFNLLLKRIEDKGLVPERYSWYLEMFKYGVPPHAGFGLGVERLVYAVTNVRNVQETILFPRTPERLVP